MPLDVFRGLLAVLPAEFPVRSLRPEEWVLGRLIYPANRGARRHGRYRTQKTAAT
jgi:hypothetical protein